MKKFVCYYLFLCFNLFGSSQIFAGEEDPYYKDIYRKNMDYKSRIVRFERINIPLKSAGKQEPIVVKDMSSTKEEYWVAKNYGKQTKSSGSAYSGCLELHEKIAADLYRLLSNKGEYLIPDTKLTIDFFEDQVEYIPTNVIARLEPRFIPIGNSEIKYQDGKNYLTDQSLEKILIEGYTRLRTIATFLSDWDWAGLKQENIGYVLESPGTGRIFKVDPAMVLKPWNGFAVSSTVDLDSLNNEYSEGQARTEFLLAIKDIVILSDDAINFIILGDGKDRNFSLEDLNRCHKSGFGNGSLNEYLQSLADLLKSRRDSIKTSYKDLK